MGAFLQTLLGGWSLLALRPGAACLPPAFEQALSPARNLARSFLRRGLAPFGGRLPGPSSPAGGELANKVFVFDAFSHRAIHPSPILRQVDLVARLRQVCTLASYERLWSLEGVGFRYSTEAWRAETPPRALLRDLPTSLLPRQAWLPLHTGMGLHLASRWLWTLGASGQRSLGRGDVESFERLCRDNAREGFGGAVFEALGFVCWNLHAWRIAGLLPGLADLGPGPLELFWHGVGRGAYLSLSGAMPGSTAGTFRQLWREPQNPAGRRNAVAGLAWALSLVNLPSPRVVAKVLADLFPTALGSRQGISQQALSQGMASALMIWHRGHGMDPLLAAFLAHGGIDPGRWRALVVRPFEAALALPPRAPEEWFRVA